MSKRFLVFPPFIPLFDGDDEEDEDDGDSDEIADPGGIVDEEAEDMEATPLDALDTAVDGGMEYEEKLDRESALLKTPLELPLPFMTLPSILRTSTPMPLPETRLNAV